MYICYKFAIVIGWKPSYAGCPKEHKDCRCGIAGFPAMSPYMDNITTHTCIPYITTSI